MRGGVNEWSPLDTQATLKIHIDLQAQLRRKGWKTKPETEITDALYQKRAITVFKRLSMQL